MVPRASFLYARIYVFKRSQKFSFSPGNHKATGKILIVGVHYFKCTEKTQDE